MQSDSLYLNYVSSVWIHITTIQILQTKACGVKLYSIRLLVISFVPVFDLLERSFGGVRQALMFFPPSLKKIFFNHLIHHIIHLIFLTDGCLKGGALSLFLSYLWKETLAPGQGQLKKNYTGTFYIKYAACNLDFWSKLIFNRFLCCSSWESTVQNKIYNYYEIKKEKKLLH